MTVRSHIDRLFEGTNLPDGTILSRKLPDDMQQLMVDWFGSNEAVPKQFPVVWIPTEDFPDVEFDDDSGDDRGGVEHARFMMGREMPPVVVADGYLLDGRHRVWAAREAGKPYVRAVDLGGYDIGPHTCSIGRMDPA